MFRSFAVFPLVSMAIAPAFGCALILDTDDYRIVDGPADSGTATQELPRLPALPDPDVRVSCEECAAEKCVDERRACLESEPCTALLACHGRCSDPNCIYRCRDIEPESATFEDYFACVFGSFGGGNNFTPRSQCPSECQAGANWACAGDYVWDRDQPGEVDVSVQVASSRAGGSTLDTLRYVEIAACEEFLPTGTLAADAACDALQPVDTYGTVRLHLGRRRSAFILRGGVTGEERIRFYDRPVPRPGRLKLRAFESTVRDVFLPAFFANQSPPVSIRPEDGMVFFRIKDCTGVAAAARVELADASSGASVRYYWVGWGAPNTAEVSAASGGFVGVPPSANVQLVAYHPVTGDLLEGRNVIVAGGWSTDVVLLPMPRP